MRLAILLFTGPVLVGAGWKMGTKCGEVLFDGWMDLCNEIGKKLESKKTQDAIE